MMRKVLSLVTVAAMAWTLLGCGADDGAALYKPGTYEGAAPGVHQDDVEVAVTVSASRIKKIEIVDHNEDTRACPMQLSSAFPRRSSTDRPWRSIPSPERRTPARRSSRPWPMHSMRRGQMSTLSTRVKWRRKRENGRRRHLSADVVVIGAGGAGLAAAVSAHQNGASVIVIEKMPNVGGNTIISGSAFNAVDPSRQEPLGIEDSIDRHYQQTFEGGDEVGNPTMVRTPGKQRLPGVTVA